MFNRQTQGPLHCLKLASGIATSDFGFSRSKFVFLNTKLNGINVSTHVIIELSFKKFQIEQQDQVLSFLWLFSMFKGEKKKGEILRINAHENLPANLGDYS